MCCISLRGVAFFGASIHIAVGFLLFSRYVIATVVFTFYNFNDLFSEKVTAFLAPFMVYVTLLLALGIIIFHSVEKECFFLLKWSSVAFSLLQLAVFVTILLLKVSPKFRYQMLPFLPDSLTSGYNSFLYAPTSPAGPDVYITVPHGATIEEKDIIKPSSKSPSSDPPDPGGGSLLDVNSTLNPSTDGSEGLLLEIQRLTILICCVLLTLVYLLFLFLYIRQLNYEDTGHVYGHAQAITRNIAFYVQPQFTGPQPPQQGNHDNNKLTASQQVQRSQTQIPSQFLPQQTQQQGHQQQNIQQQPHQSPKKVTLLAHNQIQAPSSNSPNFSSNNPQPGETGTTNPSQQQEVHRSPARQARPGQNQGQGQQQGHSIHQQGLPQQQQQLGHQIHPGQQQQGHQMHHHPPQGQPLQQGQYHPQGPGQQQNPMVNYSPKSQQRHSHGPHHTHPPSHHPHPGHVNQPGFPPQQPTQPHISAPGGELISDRSQGIGQGQIQGLRGPIPAQVRIGFYPHELRQDNPPPPLGPAQQSQIQSQQQQQIQLGQGQGGGLPHNNIRPRVGVGGGGGQPMSCFPNETEVRGQHGDYPPGQHHHQQQQMQTTGGAYQVQHQPPPLHHQQLQRLQFQPQQQSSYHPSDSASISSSVAYSPNPRVETTEGS